MDANEQAAASPGDMSESSANHVLVLDSFLEEDTASRLRGVFDDRFKDPRQGKPERFVWDWWHVADQYTLVRFFFCMCSVTLILILRMIASCGLLQPELRVQKRVPVVGIFSVRLSCTFFVLSFSDNFKHFLSAVFSFFLMAFLTASNSHPA